MLNIKPKFIVLVLSAFLLMSGCASVPPEVVQAHQIELEIIESLKTSHLAMVDAYIDQKLTALESFFFDTYGPAYLKNWKSSFKQLSSRDYDENKDFPVLYSDLVVEYQEAIKPIETMRNDLKRSINTEFTNAILAHMAINKWIKSINSLQAANKAVIDKILGGIKPGLSLDTIDKKIETVKKELEEKLNNL
jgi:hypothetical protein